MSCPAGFAPGGMFSCHVKCPDAFKYVNEGPEEGEKCVYKANNSYSIRLTPTMMLQPGEEATEQHTAELERFNEEAAEVIKRVNSDNSEITSANRQHGEQVQQFSKIQGDYASFSSVGEVVKELKEVEQSLKPMRPPTAPSSDIEIERKAILDINARKLLMIQVALATIVLCLLSYLILPVEYAHMVSFLLLSVGVAVGFFLRK